MDRFFSKLDLRDIKIDPYNTSFPPDAEETEAVEEAETGPAVEAREDPHDPPTVEDASPSETDWPQPERSPHVPAWAAADDAKPTTNGHAGYTAPVAIEEVVDLDAPAPVAPVGGNGDVLKVSARSRPSAVAGAIAGVVREAGRAEVQAIGAGATNQAVKAVVIARDYLRETGIEAICLPAFIDVTIENEDRTAIRLVVEPR